MIFLSERTVAAIATPLGDGGIGVIRISGADAIEIADKCFKAFSGVKLSALGGYEAAYGQIFDGDEVLDDGVALVFKAPKSYTGEDVVELSVHGGRLILKSVLRTVLKCGALPAPAGEFTKRAFLNGKLDLTKAESIMGLISANNDSALKIARSAKDGRIAKTIQKITDMLLETAASISVFADYPDEDIPSLSEENFGKMLRLAIKETEMLSDTYDTGKLIMEGINCAIVGKPNVGKSTLMNLLSGNERSIVTDVAGTTRDVIEETVTLGDITLRLSDTAGIHETEDTVESVGVIKARERLGNADLIFAVFDVSSPLDQNDLNLLEELKDKKVLIILNKTDLNNVLSPDDFEGFEVVSISAKNATGTDALRIKIEEITRISSLNPDAAVLMSEHQHYCAVKTLEALKEAEAALLGGATLDAVGVCIDDALSYLLELTGKRVTNEVADEIFRRFCVGK